MRWNTAVLPVRCCHGSCQALCARATIPPPTRLRLGNKRAWWLLHRRGRWTSYDICARTEAAGTAVHSMPDDIVRKTDCLTLLHYAYEEGLPWDSPSACELAVFCPACTTVLRFLHEHGCPWNYSFGRLHSMLGVPAPPRLPLQSSYRAVSTVTVSRTLGVQAANNNHTECVTLLQQYGYTLTLTAAHMRAGRMLTVVFISAT
jgi:hypothetical protein